MEVMRIKNGLKTYIIAEVAQSHDGSLGLAHAFIDAAADAGADAVKFQTHFASYESTLDEPFRVKFSRQDKTRYDYWKRMEFTQDQWVELKQHAEDKKIDFLSSAFSLKAVEMLDRMNMLAWKIGSGEVGNKDLMQAILNTKKPILLSTGLSSLGEIDSVVEFIQEKKIPLSVFQCTTQYPTPLDKVGVNVLELYKKKYSSSVGLSDHSGTIFPSIYAIANDVDFIEVHVTFDKRMFGPDVTSSVTFKELKVIMEARDAFHVFKNNPIDKNEAANNFKATKEIFARSIALDSDYKAGHRIKMENIILKKPGTGIAPQFKEQIVGKTLIRDVSANRLLKWEDIS